MNWRDYPRPTIHGLYFATALEGPGDPRWKDDPQPHIVRRILLLTESDSRGQIWYFTGGTRRKLKTAADYVALNRMVRFQTFTNTNYPT